PSLLPGARLCRRQLSTRVAIFCRTSRRPLVSRSLSRSLSSSSELYAKPSSYDENGSGFERGYSSSLKVSAEFISLDPKVPSKSPRMCGLVFLNRRISFRDSSLLFSRDQ